MISNHKHNLQDAIAYKMFRSSDQKMVKVLSITRHIHTHVEGWRRVN